MVNANYQVAHLKLPAWKAIHVRVHVHACCMHVHVCVGAINRNKGWFISRALESVVVNVDVCRPH